MARNGRSAPRAEDVAAAKSRLTRRLFPESQGLKDGASSDLRHHLQNSFSLLYESKDSKLCVFEDKQGHLSAVNAARLA